MDTLDTILKVLSVFTAAITLAKTIIDIRNNKKDTETTNFTHNIKIQTKTQNTQINNCKTYQQTINQYSSSNHSAQSNSRVNDDSSYFFFLLILSVIFIFVAFIALKRLKVIIVSLLLLLSIFTILYNWIKWNHEPELRNDREYLNHIILCVIGCFLPLASYIQIAPPLAYDVFYDQIFAGEKSNLSAIIANMFLHIIKLERPTYYYLSVFVGIILAAMVLIFNLKVSVSYYKFKRPLIIFRLCLSVLTILLITSCLFWIMTGTIQIINKLLSWVKNLIISSV